ncbi:protein a6 [Drosophila persimilis]|uniref:protein a6 n=1 Tax=Drosophila persimilis TaxID=7234 RepID=UPI000F07393C|nr:protein a6 [Drosophila persimilis]
MTQRHSEPFYISPRLFDNRRLKRRRCKWMERLREHQQTCKAEMRAQQAFASKTERGRRRCPATLQRHHLLAAATLPADVTIDLLSDDDDDTNDVNAIVEPRPKPVPAGASSTCNSLFMHQPNLLLMPATTLSIHQHDGGGGGSRGYTQRRVPKHGMSQGNAVTTTCVLGRGTSTSTHSQSLTESILITSDDENNDNAIAKYVRRQHSMRSPPPLAPLTLSETVEEVTVSLVPRNTTTANCQARLRHSHPPHSGNYKACNIPSAPPHTATTNGMGRAASSNSGHGNGNDGYLEVDVGSGITATLPDETTVHTVIANRIYELSLSKLREGLASSGVPEYTHDLLPEQLQKLSPALRAKVAPLVAPSPPTPISLKLSSDLSISLISDDDDCESSSINNTAGGLGSDLVYPVVAAEAHAAAKLLKQQQPQLSVVQHLQYAGGGFAPPVALALPVMAHTATTSTVPLPRRRKLG